MARADRLLMLLQVLRRHRRPVTAERLAGELEVSVRTIYRDISGLAADGVPIRGEAGVGYVLGEGYDLPPLMFSADEIEAVLIGMQWVGSRGDAGLRRAAEDVLAKVGAVLPEHLRPVLRDATLGVPRFDDNERDEVVDVGALRRAIRERRKVLIAYRDVEGRPSRRTIWPIGLGYFEASRVLVAWCELRNGFRHFRTDRMAVAEVQANRYPGTRHQLLGRWRDSEPRLDGMRLIEP